MKQLTEEQRERTAQRYQQLRTKLKSVRMYGNNESVKQTIAELRAVAAELRAWKN